MSFTQIPMATCRCKRDYEKLGSYASELLPNNNSRHSSICFGGELFISVTGRVTVVSAIFL
jgi:hypothetical protein